MKNKRREALLAVLLRLRNRNLLRNHPSLQPLISSALLFRSPIPRPRPKRIRNDSPIAYQPRQPANNPPSLRVQPARPLLVCRLPPLPCRFPWPAAIHPDPLPRNSLPCPIGSISMIYWTIPSLLPQRLSIPSAIVPKANR